MKKKVMLVFGTRPEAIKMAPLVLEMRKSDFIETVVAVTGQHREMLDQVLSIFNIKPDYDLNIMKPDQDLYDVSSLILLGLRDVLRKETPQLVLVHGDTTTSSIAALAAFYMHIPVGHIEAGLRTHDIYNPWPEEINRQITGRIASYHFAPTPLSKNNLCLENISENNILVTGNTVIDALYSVVDYINSNNVIKAKITDDIQKTGYDTDRIKNNRRLVLITGHRRENFGEGLDNICQALRVLALRNKNVDFVYPMHLNPNVRKPIHHYFDNADIDNIFFIEPLEYLNFVYLMSKSYLILTDSGGIQEEAPGLGIPVLVMRTTTERPEAVDAGTVKLVGTDRDTIIEQVSCLLDNNEEYEAMHRAVNPYGDGCACERIVKFIEKNI